MDIYLLVFLWVSRLLIMGSNGAKFTVQPSDFKALEANDASFVCFVSDLQTGQVISWIKDSVKISSQSTVHLSREKYQVQVSNSSTAHSYLHIKHVEQKDSESLYFCRVYNSDGSVDTTSNKASLIVQEIPAEHYPICEVAPNVNYRTDSAVSLICQAEKTRPLVQLELIINGRKESNQVTSDDKVTLTYTFRPTEKNNGDTFLCIMRSTVEVGGSDLQRNCTTTPLVYNFKPIVTIKGSGKMERGKEALFICSHREMPVSTRLSWSFNRDIDKSRYSTEYEQILRIISPDEDLSGVVIRCTVENEVGTSFDEVTIISMDKIKDGIVTFPTTTTSTLYTRSINGSQQNIRIDTPRVGENSSSDSWHDNIATVAIVAGLALVIFLLIALLPIVCIKYYRKHSNRGYSQARAESETYAFGDPRIRQYPILLPFPIEEEPQSQWTRTIGTQVSEDDVAPPPVQVVTAEVAAEVTAEVAAEATADPIYIEIPPDRYIYSSASL